MARDTRDRILVALRTLLSRGGTSAATLDNVAAEAGVSKGGLLYHFPSKQALFAGLIEQTTASVAVELGALGSRDEVVRTYLEYVAPRDDLERGFVLALINGVREEAGGGDRAGEQDSDDARVLGVFADIFAAWEEPVRAAVDDPVTAEIILQVGNGWYLSAIAGLRTPDPELLQAVIDRLLAAAR